MSQDSYDRLYKDLIDSSKRFMSAWQQQFTNSSPQGAATGNIPVSSPMLQIGFFKEAQNLFERLMWFPPFSMIEGTAGPSMKQYKTYWELVGLYMQLYQEWLNVYLDFSRVLMTTVTETNSKLFSEAATTLPSEVYGKWIAGMESGIDALLREETFASKLGSLLSRMLDVRKKSDEFMEDYYSMMNIPTKSEMKRVYKELYLLKKKVRELSSSPEHGKGSDQSMQKRGAEETA